MKERLGTHNTPHAPACVFHFQPYFQQGLEEALQWLFANPEIEEALASMPDSAHSETETRDASASNHGLHAELDGDLVRIDDEMEVQVCFWEIDL